jgi:hypothetical protein
VRKSLCRCGGQTVLDPMPTDTSVGYRECKFLASSFAPVGDGFRLPVIAVHAAVPQSMGEAPARSGTQAPSRAALTARRNSLNL